MRIALATAGTTGDVRPFAILARALVDRGHEVTAVTWPVHAAALSSPGVRIETAGPHAELAEVDRLAAEAAGRGSMEQVALLRDFHLRDGAAHCRRLRELFTGHDLVVIHGVHALAHAAVLDAGLPWATLVFDPVLLPTPSLPPPGMPNLGPGNPLLWTMLDRALRRIGGPLDEVLEAAGSNQRGLPLFRARSERLHLVACSPSLMRLPDVLPPATRIVGAIVDPAPPATLPLAVETFLDAGPAPFVMAFGSMRGLDIAVQDAAAVILAEAGHHIIVQGDGEDRPGILHVGELDHRALFPRVSGVVHHAGAGTSHAVARAGVPSLTVPQIGDQRYWADRLHRLGVAPRPLSLARITPARVARATVEMGAKSAMRTAAGALAARMSEEDGLAASVALLEEAVP
ncbi:MAG: glycosyltransferase [Candidatus Limnocylindria bacterium]